MSGAAQAVVLRVRRQDAADQPNRWEEFSVPLAEEMTVASCLHWIFAHPLLSDGKPTTPPVWEADCLDEGCGACAMVINGKVRLACKTPVGKLLRDADEITLEPLSKFPVVRDLVVDKGRFLSDLRRMHAWIPIDGAYDLGAPSPLARRAAEQRYMLSPCTQCGCCMEACPQYSAASKFVGAAVINQARLFNDHPISGELKPHRLQALMGEGGVQDCGKSGNCVEVCPEKIPLLESIAVVQRQATLHMVKKLFS